jgi:hypothetical protein
VLEDNALFVESVSLVTACVEEALLESLASEFEIGWLDRVCNELLVNAETVLAESIILVVVISEVNSSNPAVVVAPCTTSALY